MFATIVALGGKAALAMVGSLLTEKLFTKVIARIAVPLIEKLVKSTETTVDDTAAAPIIAKLKENY